MANEWHARPSEVGGGRRKTEMERIVETLANGLGNGVGWLADHGILFGIFAVIWVAFGVGLVWGHGGLDQAWQTIRAMPLPIQLVVWVLLLPAVLGLWIWETTWPVVVRLVLVAGIAGWNLLVLLPKAMQAPQP
jgi:hypothetical protein